MGVDKELLKGCIEPHGGRARGPSRREGRAGKLRPVDERRAGGGVVNRVDSFIYQVLEIAELPADHEQGEEL